MRCARQLYRYTHKCVYMLFLCIRLIRKTFLNHLIHHRGQVEVYLRLNDVPLPALYGPSADEGISFAGA